MMTPEEWYAVLSVGNNLKDYVVFELDAEFHPEQRAFRLMAPSSVHLIVAPRTKTPRAMSTTGGTRRSSTTPGPLSLVETGEGGSGGSGEGGGSGSEGGSEVGEYEVPSTLPVSAVMTRAAAARPGGPVDPVAWWLCWP